MYDPMMSYYLAAEKQRDRLHEAKLDRQARAAAPDRAAPDLTGLVQRVLDRVWKRLGLPAEELGARATSQEAPVSSR